MSINKLLLDSFIERHKDQYLNRRNSNTNWGESYKWKHLPKIAHDLANFESPNAENIKDILKAYTKSNPNQGTFIDWRELDDINHLISTTNGWQLIREIWDIDTTQLAEVIDSNNDSSFMSLFGLSGKKFSPRTYGFLLAGRSPDKFPIFLQSKFDFLKSELGYEDEWRSISLGEKYQYYTEATQYIGTKLKAELDTYKVGDTVISTQFTALDGQDFIYVSEHIASGTANPVTNKTAIEGASLSHLLKEATLNYADNTVLKFEKSSFTELITDSIPKKIESIISSNNYSYKGSVGTGNWAETPWVAVLDKKITDSTRTGYYVCYLLNSATQSLYLCLAVGWTQFADKYSAEEAKQRISKYSQYLLSRIDNVPDGFTPGQIDLNAKKTLSKGYEVSEIISKKYDAHRLNEDELIKDLKNILTTYHEVSLIAGDSIDNIDYDLVFRDVDQDSADLKINNITLQNNLDDIMAQLNDLLSDTPPKQVVRLLRKAARNPKIAGLYKASKKYICELCGREPFIQRNGKPYAEADHIKPLGNGGFDSADNIRCLCAQCHAIVTHGSDEEIENLIEGMNHRTG